MAALSELPRFDSIAFCGGCAKGAYQIGVWKALLDLGLTDGVRAVSGTSIGGINAALFALGNFPRARKLWTSVRGNIAFTPGGRRGDGIFSRDGLLKFLDQIDLEALGAAPVQVWCNIHKAGAPGAESVLLNGLPPEKIRDVLLATSAMPLAYKNEWIGGKKYVDGGVTGLGNIPVEPLYSAGCRRILIVSLNERFGFNPRTDFLSGSVDLYRLCEGAELSVIAPLQPLNDTVFNGILPDVDFSPRAVRAKMIAGYQDAGKLLRKEGVYMMRKDHPKINAYIRLKIGEMFHNGEEFRTFVETTNFSWFNIPMKVPGFYTDIANVDGWRVQQDNLFKDHYRVVDPEDVCRAYTFDPDDIINALDSLDAAEHFFRDML